MHELLGSGVGELTHQPDGRDLVADHLIDAPHDNVIHARVLDKADLQLGLHDRDIARYVAADDLPLVFRGDAALEFFLDGRLSGCARRS
ncbi:MAG TPA: hypothetical protein VG308_04860 [Stellaceae bacterium]|nr:hypothetical protein [Stellaceae bacterium]